MPGQIAPDAVEYVLQMLLKAADMTHTTAATDQHLFWTACLEEEMYRQVQSPALGMHCSCRIADADGCMQQTHLEAHPGA